MVQALAHGLPGALGALCEVLGVPQDKAKDKEGKALIQLFCKPRPKNSKLRRATSKTTRKNGGALLLTLGLISRHARST
jgi:DNA polymerase